MSGLTDGQIDAIQFPVIDYATAHVIRTHRRTFARAVIAADRELQDAKLTNAPTDSQINDALKVFACTVIGADRAIQDARHLEELNAYALTVSNLRAEIAGRGVPDATAMADVLMGWPLPKDFNPDCGISFDGRKNDEWNTGRTWPTGTNLLDHSQAKAMFEYVLASAPHSGVPDGWRLVPRVPDGSMINAGVRADKTSRLFSAEDVYRAMVTEAPQPPARPERPINCGSGHCSCIECVAQETCKWTQNDEWWSAACGASWAFIDCGPVENSVKFCHGCGKPVEIVGAK